MKVQRGIYRRPFYTVRHDAEATHVQGNPARHRHLKMFAPAHIADGRERAHETKHLGCPFHTSNLNNQIKKQLKKSRSGST
jgi:hypothetical protein